MIKNYLKTSKLNLPGENKLNNIVYLGDWCFDLDEKLKFKSDYYLKSSKNKEENFEYLFKLKNKILNSLIKFLNSLHGINKDYKYWNFIISPWLIHFLQVIHDRWMVFENQDKNLNNLSLYTLLIDIDDECITPKEFYSGKHFFYQDLWNHYLFGEIIKFRGKIKYELKNIFHENLNQVLSTQKSIQIKKAKYVYFLNLFSNFFYNKKKINQILFLTDVHYFFQIKTYLKFKQPPYFFAIPPNYIDKPLNIKARKAKIDFDAKNNFEKFIENKLIKFLPKSIIENYDEIIKNNKKYYENFKSKNFFIPQLDIPDRVIFYLAEQEQAKKIIYQHGGCYGLMKNHYRELIEIELSDYFLTFGWDAESCQKLLSNENKKKIISFYPLHLPKNKIDTKKNKLNFLILDEFPNYYYENSSNYDAHTYKLYILNILNFVKNLKTDFLQDLLIRLHPAQQLGKVDKVIRENFPDVKIDYGSTNIIENLKKSKLCIIANNSTTFLQTLRLNIPTVLFWDTNYISIRETALDKFNLLRKNNIFFEDSSSAANFCNQTKNIYKWWHDENRQKAVNSFINSYATKDEWKLYNLFKIIN